MPFDKQKESVDPKTQKGEDNYSPRFQTLNSGSKKTDNDYNQIAGHSFKNTKPSNDIGPDHQQECQDQDDFVDVDELKEQEVKLEEELSGYTQRLLDIHDEIEIMNQTGWENASTRVDAISKLSFFKEKLNRIQEKAICRPELHARIHLSMRPEYRYINVLKNAWKLANVAYQKAYIYVNNLPPDQPMDVNSKTESTDLMTKKNRRSADFKNEQKKPEEPTLKNLNIGDEYKHNFASLTGTKSRNYFGNHEIPVRGSKSDIVKGFYSRTETKRGSRTEPIPTDQFDKRFHFPQSQRRDQYLPGFQTQVPNAPFSSHSMNDWVVVRTTENPEITKPRHYGRITDLSQLFKNSFQESSVYEPGYKGHDRHVLAEIKVIVYGNQNLDLFKDFEQGILLKIINNKVLNWDAKFLFLLENLSGSPLSTVTAYTDALTMANFVQALEDLWYAYGRPSILQKILISKLRTGDPVDINKLETLKNTEALITKIFRTFGWSTNDDNYSFLLESIRMTNATHLSFTTYLVIRHLDRTLPNFKKWLAAYYASHPY